MRHDAIVRGLVPDGLLTHSYMISQDKLTTKLRLGVVLSIVWLAGLGSAYSVYLGITGLLLIRQSEGALIGRGKALWCVIAGGLGLTFWLFVNLMAVLGN